MGSLALLTLGGGVFGSLSFALLTEDVAEISDDGDGGVGATRVVITDKDCKEDEAASDVETGTEDDIEPEIDKDGVEADDTRSGVEPIDDDGKVGVVNAFTGVDGKGFTGDGFAEGEEGGKLEISDSEGEGEG